MVLLDENKMYYKSELHCHSTNSDGRLSVKELKAEFKKRGYSVVAFTDHEHLIDNSAYDDDNFLTITSCELAIKENANESTLRNFDMKVCHLNYFAFDQHNTLTPCYSSVYDHFKNPEIEKLIKHDDEYERKYSAECINEMIRLGNEKGFLIQYNHPAWSLENALQYLKYDGLFSVEVYNHSCVHSGGNDNCIYAFDDILRSGKKLYCTMCDDCHIKSGIDSAECDAFGGFVMINAKKLEYGEIMSALREGRFYASQGPEIYGMTAENGIVKIKTSDALQISYSTRGRRTAARNASFGEKINYAEFEIKDTDGYFRITVTDEYGKKACSQAYFINEL